MRLLASIIRASIKLRFKLLGLATIKDIPTKEFNELARKLADTGWKNKSAYDGFDAWADYGCLKLRRNFTSIKLEWDNWTEGSIEGPRKVIEQIAKDAGLAVTYEWRWSEYDDAFKRS